MHLRLLFILFFALTALVSPSPAPAAAQASAAPTCTYSCPGTDKGGVALMQASTPATGTLRCTYLLPMIAGGSTLYCDYNSSSGTLATDRDMNNCPATAMCTTSKRRALEFDADDPYAAYKRHAARRAAVPNRAPVPKFMAHRAELGRRKYLDRR